MHDRRAPQWPLFQLCKTEEMEKRNKATMMGLNKAYYPQKVTSVEIKVSSSNKSTKPFKRWENPWYDGFITFIRGEGRSSKKP